MLPYMEGLCRCDSIKNFDLGRLSELSRQAQCNDKGLYKRDTVRSDREGDVMTEQREKRWCDSEPWAKECR